MKSHQYAEKLKAAAEFLLSRENAEITEVDMSPYISLYFYQKEAFIAAVRVFGAGSKKWTDDYLQFIPGGPCEIFTLAIRRSNICRLKRPAEYECEPILSDEEVAAL